MAHDPIRWLQEAARRRREALEAERVAILEAAEAAFGAGGPDALYRVEVEQEDGGGWVVRLRPLMPSLWASGPMTAPPAATPQPSAGQVAAAAVAPATDRVDMDPVPEPVAPPPVVPAPATALPRTEAVPPAIESVAEEITPPVPEPGPMPMPTLSLAAGAKRAAAAAPPGFKLPEPARTKLAIDPTASADAPSTFAMPSTPPPRADDLVLPVLPALSEGTTDAAVTAVSEAPAEEGDQTGLMAILANGDPSVLLPPVSKRPNPFLVASLDPRARALQLARTLAGDMIAYAPEVFQNAKAGGPVQIRTAFAAEITRAQEEYARQVDAEAVPDAQEVFTLALEDALANGERYFA